MRREEEYIQNARAIYIYIYIYNQHTIDHDDHVCDHHHRTQRRRGTLAPSVNATAKRRITATAASKTFSSSSTFKRESSFFADQKVASRIGKGRDAALTTTRSRKLVTVHASDAKTPPETFAAAVATSEKKAGADTMSTFALSFTAGALIGFGGLLLTSVGVVVAGVGSCKSRSLEPRERRVWPSVWLEHGHFNRRGVVHWKRVRHVERLVVEKSNPGASDEKLVGVLRRELCRVGVFSVHGVHGDDVGGESSTSNCNCDDESDDVAVHGGVRERRVV